MAAALVSDFLGHKDKEVRLYAVLCCMELFSIVSYNQCLADDVVIVFFVQCVLLCVF